jgi:hypothetical protein
MDDRGFESREGLGIFLFTNASRPALGPTQPPIQWVPGAPSLEVKRSRREADHSPPSSAEVKKAWSYNFTPQYAFMEWSSVNKKKITETNLPLRFTKMYIYYGFSRIVFIQSVQACKFQFSSVIFIISIPGLLIGSALWVLRLLFQ